jgi:tRNA (cytidine32/uridine32-2'-O)-methyltransferase
MSLLDNIRIALSHPSHPGNIGATARAMKTMGLSKLFLVNPKKFPDEQAIALSAGAEDILENAQVTESLLKAVEGCHLIIATSARLRRLPWPQWNPEQAASIALKAARKGEVAILFGSERIGLLNEELEMAHGQLVIPANPDYSSLNLASAVQIISYALRVAFLHDFEKDTDVKKKEMAFATIEEIEGFYQHLQTVLIDIDFLPKERPVKLMRRLRRLFQRTRLTSVEVNILRGILTAAQRRIS